ncbi:TPA: conjugal transfer protein [Streptococcus agalactiae]|nr:conjugal transfer protein [Streptococcus agalactiae]HEM9599378.1 conjugal transfer protein [Streptococcus agalactiae]HEM9636273.1 conjugal transfer protein [Streptococcus agalactiae]
MNEKISKFILTILKYIILLFIGLYFAVIVTGSIMGLSQYKLEISKHFKDTIISLMLHPLKYYLLYFNQKNPILILISIAVAIYLAYFAIKKGTKNNEWKTDGKITHGSASWGNLNEVLNQYYKISPKDITANFKNSFDESILEKVNFDKEEN